MQAEEVLAKRVWAGIWFQVPASWFRVVGWWLLVVGCWLIVCCTNHRPFKGSQSLVPVPRPYNTLYLLPCTQCPIWSSSPSLAPRVPSLKGTKYLYNQNNYLFSGLFLMALVFLNSNCSMNLRIGRIAFKCTAYPCFFFSYSNSACTKCFCYRSNLVLMYVQGSDRMFYDWVFFMLTIIILFLNIFPS